MEQPGLDINRVVESGNYYVYGLFRPGAESPFYVGKGRYYRVFGHEYDARNIGRDASQKDAKLRTIHEIWESGQEVQRVIFYETPDERESYRYELNLIEVVYGRKNLTNLQPGVRSSDLQRSTFAELRAKAGMTQFELARVSGVSIPTLHRMEHGKNVVPRRLAYKVLNVFSKRLGYDIKLEDLEDLQVR